MHTSQALRSSHFEYRRPDAAGRVAFSAFCGGYHDQDRGGSDFFIYPQHFAFIGEDSSRISAAPAENGRADRVGIATRAGRLDLTLDEAGIGGAWAWLDVWPKSNWFTAPAAPAAMLQKVFDLHINRLFWPHNFTPEHRQEQETENGEDAHSALPDYARRILQTRLKSVYYYNTSAPTVEIYAAQPAVDIVQVSMEHLPEAVRQTLPRDAHLARPPGQESYRQVGVDDFLADMEACFTA